MRSKRKWKLKTLLVLLCSLALYLAYLIIAGWNMSIKMAVSRYQSFYCEVKQVDGEYILNAFHSTVFRYPRDAFSGYDDPASTINQRKADEVSKPLSVWERAGLAILATLAHQSAEMRADHPIMDGMQLAMNLNGKEYSSPSVNLADGRLILLYFYLQAISPLEMKI